MMTLLMFIFVALFCLKIVWNLGTPYVLACRRLKADASSTAGISMATVVEIVLLLLAVTTAALANGTTWFHSPKHLAIWGTIAIVASYAHLVIGGVLAGWVVSLIKRR
jgi:hypothetical protein